MQTVHLTCYFIVTILTRSLGVALLSGSQRLNRKMAFSIYVVTLLLSYYTLSSYVAYLDFALICITIAGACLCMNMIWVALNGTLKLSRLRLLGTGLVLTGGLLLIVL